MTSRAALFDACVAEMTPEQQANISKLVKWVCVNMLRQENAEMSAKELIVQALRFEEMIAIRKEDANIRNILSGAS